MWANLQLPRENNAREEQHPLQKSLPCFLLAGLKIASAGERSVCIRNHLRRQLVIYGRIQACVRRAASYSKTQTHRIFAGVLCAPRDSGSVSSEKAFFHLIYTRPCSRINMHQQRSSPTFAYLSALLRAVFQIVLLAPYVPCCLCSRNFGSCWLCIFLLLLRMRQMWNSKGQMFKSWVLEMNFFIVLFLDWKTLVNQSYKVFFVKVQ